MKELFSHIIRPGVTLIFAVAYCAACLWYPDAIPNLKDPMLLTLAFWFGSRAIEKANGKLIKAATPPSPPERPVGS